MPGEVPAGAINGTTGSDGNPTFTTTVPYYAASVYNNGVFQDPTRATYDPATKTITFFAPYIPVGGATPDSLYIVGITAVANTPNGIDNGPGGSSSLSSLRTRVRSEADIEGDPNITDTELNTWINQSRYRLYDMLIAAYGDDYYTAKATIQLDGVNTEFNLPDGTLYSAAPAFYKGQIVEAISGGLASPDAPITLRRFNLREKNRYLRPYPITVSPAALPLYRIMGSNPGNLVFTPKPQAMNVRIWYAPKLSPLVNDGDVADDFSGWLEFVVIDCAIKALGKQERDASLLIGRRNEMKLEIEKMASNRDIGEPNTVSTTNDGGWPYGGGGAGFGGLGGFWS